MQKISYSRHRFSTHIIRHAGWLYTRFTLSYRDVEDLLAERGPDISYETVRRWFWRLVNQSPETWDHHALLLTISSTSMKWSSSFVKNGTGSGEQMTMRERSWIFSYIKTIYKSCLEIDAENIDNKRSNNRAENSHLTIRQRERKMQKFKSPWSAQRFLNIQSAAYNGFYVQRHLLNRPHLKQCRAKDFGIWVTASAAAWDFVTEE